MNLSEPFDTFDHKIILYTLQYYGVTGLPIQSLLIETSLQILMELNQPNEMYWMEYYKVLFSALYFLSYAQMTLIRLVNLLCSNIYADANFKFLGYTRRYQPQVTYTAQ